MAALWQDVRYGVRMVAKNPGVSLVAVLTLALGIGANTALFSVVDAVLLEPLPYAEPDRVVALWETQPSNEHSRWRMTPADFQDVRAQGDVFEEVAAYGANAFTLTGEGEPEQILGVTATSGYFRVLGVRPVLGRFFGEDSEQPGSDPVVVIGHGLWVRRFGAAPGILGRTITLDETPYTVIGVMPPGIYPGWPRTTGSISFESRQSQFWVPQRRNAAFSANRRSHVLGVLARMKPGVTIEGAQHQLDVIAARLGQEYPAKQGEGLLARPLIDEAVGNVRPALLILLVAVGVMLLIACANVASLLLARLASRQREIAVRAALGAGRKRLVRQFLVEGFVLGVVSAGVGVWLAVFGIDFVLRLIPEEIPRLTDVALNLRVLSFTLGITALTSVLYAFVPAVQASRPSLTESLKEAARGSVAGLRRQHLRSGLVVSQVALAVLLVTAAGLLAKSTWRLMQVDPGFSARSVLIAGVGLPPSKYQTWQQVQSFFSQLEERVRQIPGVEVAAIGYDDPLTTSWIDSFAIEGEAVPNPDLPYSEAFRPVSPGFFRALGIDVLRGRGFTEQDEVGRPGVAIINEVFARRYLGDTNPLGCRLRVGTPRRFWGERISELFEIVGVVRDVRSAGLRAPPEPGFYIPARQFPLQGMSLFVRTSGDPLAIAAAVRGVVLEMDSAQPVSSVSTLGQLLEGQLAQRRFNMALMGMFGGVSLVLVLVGLYGLLSYTVTCRTNEIGIRMALGAAPGKVLRLVIREGLLLVAIGVVAGIVAALGLMRLLASQLYGVSATDPVVFAAVTASLAAVALLACWVPARRAASVDPMTALRHE